MKKMWFDKFSQKTYDWIIEISGRRLDILMWGSGATGAILDWVLNNWEALSYFILIGLSSLIMKAIKFREDMKQLRELNQLALEERKAQLSHTKNVQKLTERKLLMELGNDDQKEK